MGFKNMTWYNSTSAFCETSMVALTGYGWESSMVVPIEYLEEFQGTSELTAEEMTKMRSSLLKHKETLRLLSL